ncbi:hypothetical protein CFP56_011361 [Quercus suber]|uniref:Uncharacterized protein n=1 Tax=Quercus suber TaxID=58331 RepID=A0AAW0MJ12_QUESU
MGASFLTVECGPYTLFFISNYPSEVPSYQWDPSLKSHPSYSVAVKKDLTVKTELSGDNLIKYLPPPFNLNRSSSPSSLSLSQHTIRTPRHNKLCKKFVDKKNRVLV